MSNRLVKQAVTSYVPAVQEVIAQPARCVAETTRERVTRWKSEAVRVGGYYFVWKSTPYTVYVDVTREVCYPAVQGVDGRDATLVVDNQLGWNAGAVSLSARGGDLLATFQIGAGSVGVLCGLAPAGSASTDFGAIQHGVLHSTGNSLRVVERGVVVATSPLDPVPGDTLRISRRGAVVQYQLGAWSYVSTLASSGSKQLSALLYCAGDAVDNPALRAASSLRTHSTWSWASPADAGQLRARSPWGWSGRAALNDGYMSDTIGMSLLAADYDYGTGTGEVADLVLTAAAGFIEVEASGVATTLPMTMQGSAIDIDIGQMSDTMGMSMIAADYDYGSARLDLGDITGFALENLDPPGAGSYSEATLLADTYSFDPVIYAVFSSGLEVGDVLDVVLAIDGVYADFLGLSDAVSATMVLEALIQTGLTIDDNASSVARTLLQYATNVLTGGVARYQGFDFGGFARTTDETYGWKSDGLYRIGADTDDGALLSAIVDMAAEEFGTAQRKRLDNLFLGLSTDGQVFVSLTDDNNSEVVYRARAKGSEYRVDAQRGRSSRFWRMRLELVDATYAELDNVEWVVGATGRRTTR